MDVALPGYTPSSTPGSSQVSGSSSRLKELHERLHLKNRESPARVDLPSTWGEQPVRSVVISSYKKNTEGRYHRHNRKDWSTASWTGGIASITRLGWDTSRSHVCPKERST